MDVKSINFYISFISNYFNLYIETLGMGLGPA